MLRWKRGTRNWRLCDEDYGGIIWVDESEFVLDARALLNLLPEIVVWNLVHRSIPDLLEAKSPASQKFGASTVHEPHLELGVTWERTRLERLAGARDIVRAKNGLLKGFFKHQGQGQIESLKDVI